MVRIHYGPKFSKRIIKPSQVELYMYKRSLKWLMYLGRYAFEIPAIDVMLMRVQFKATNEQKIPAYNR